MKGGLAIGLFALDALREVFIAVQALENSAAGTTVCPGVVHGGTKPYVVPGQCRVTADIRVATLGRAGADARGCHGCNEQDLDAWHSVARDWQQTASYSEASGCFCAFELPTGKLRLRLIGNPQKGCGVRPTHRCRAHLAARFSPAR